MNGAVAIGLLIASLFCCAMIAPAAWKCGGFSYPCFDNAMGWHD